MDNIEYLEVVDEQETIERLAHGYKENIEQTIVTALYQFEEINTRLSEGDLKWSQFIKANFILANSHLLATLVSIGKDTDFMVEDDEEYLAELREGYAEKDEEALQVCMIKTLIRIDDAHEALKLGDLSWQPFLLEIREECRLNFKAMEEVAKAFQKKQLVIDLPPNSTITRAYENPSRVFVFCGAISLSQIYIHKILTNQTSTAFAGDNPLRVDSKDGFFAGITLGQFAVLGSADASGSAFAYGIHGGYRHYFNDRISSDVDLAYVGANSGSNDKFFMPTVNLGYDFLKGKENNGSVIGASLNYKF